MGYLILFMIVIGLTLSVILYICKGTDIFSPVAVMCIGVYIFMCLILFMFVIGDYEENRPKQIDRGGITYGNHR